MELKDVLNNPGTAAYSRVKYIPRFASEEKMVEFINGLFQKAVEAKYKGDWEELSEFLDQWEDFAIELQFSGMKIPELEGMPWATLKKPLSQCRIALITTGGVFIEGQTPFERGDFSYREIPRDVSKETLRIWHPGYDHGPAEEDINCIFPLDRFQEMEAEGIIGELAQTQYSFMGLINEPEALINGTAPEVGRLLKEAEVDAVFLAST